MPNNKPPYEVKTVVIKSQYVLDRYFFHTYEEAHNKYTELLATMPNTIDVELSNNTL